MNDLDRAKVKVDFTQTLIGHKIMGMYLFPTAQSCDNPLHVTFDRIILVLDDFSTVTITATTSGPLCGWSNPPMQS